MINKVLEEFTSPINGPIRIERILGWGTVIRAANLTQSGGILYDIWKKSLKKVHGEKTEVEKALVLGLGGGSLVKVIHKFWHEANVIGVDIDPLMVEMGKKHLGLKDEEVEIVISDATKFCKKQVESKVTYDLVCIDTYQGDVFPTQFENESFLSLIHKLLNSDGVAVFNRLYYDDKRPLAVKFSKKLSTIFNSVESVYPEANVMFVCKK